MLEKKYSPIDQSIPQQMKIPRDKAVPQELEDSLRIDPIKAVLKIEFIDSLASGDSRVKCEVER